ncbi:methyltransferase domain-containing protein [Thioalkalivibrio sp.]|uniref:methyltransferase domain-containing protein n=1 Tax=Thioalkalivibrio sp. TaxID=2093813 RepID=UPI003561A04E
MPRFDPFDDLAGKAPRSPGSGSAGGLGIALRWHSVEAAHLDSRVLSCPAPEALPTALRGLLAADGAGTVTRAFDPGELLPDWQDARMVTVPGGFFRRTLGRSRVEPRAGRFYPGPFLEGAPGLPPGTPTAFRVISIAADGEIAVDFNHPLAGLPVDLELRLLDLSPPVEPPADVGRAAVTNGPGMQSRWRGQPTDFGHGAPFARADAGPDAEFYASPRMVQHIDDAARARIARLYRALLPETGDVLDLMSSWTSHLDPAASALRVAGLGMNAEELAANPMLRERVVHDLNLEPRLPWPDARFDAVICTVSVEYLVRPVEVFREVRRVLRPGARFLVTFSNRWFPPKAIVPWAELHEFERMGLVLEFFLEAGGFGALNTWSLRGLPRPPEDPYAGRLATADPVYAIWGQAM